MSNTERFHRGPQPRTLVAVRAHPGHFALVTRGQPALQVRLVFPEVDVADADRREAQLRGPAADRRRQIGQRCVVGSSRFGHGGDRRCGTYN